MPKDELGEMIAAGAVVNAASFLKGVAFPARRPELERYAREHGADDSAIDEIRRLPMGQEFRDPMELFEALGAETRGM